MSSCKTRIRVAAISLSLAVLGVLTARGFVFSGDATHRARFVLGMIQDWLITAAFASTALVVSIPVFWRGTKRQILVAVAFALLAAMILAFSFLMLA